MDLTPIGVSGTLVVQLHMAADGTWSMHVNGASIGKEIALVPVTLIIRLWRPSDVQMLRGTIQICGSPHCVAFQSNAELLELVHDWLQNDGTIN